jgi:hypothetical protein
LVGTQSVSQHERTPVQGSLVGTHCVSRSQRCVVGSHPPSQQSLFCSQMSPPARQKLKKEQRPPRHTPEQQLLLPLQSSPRGVQLEDGWWQVPPVQTLPQHWTLEVQVPPATTHVLAVEHFSVVGSQ